MTSQMPSIAEVLVAWGPMLLIVAVWIFFMVRFMKRGGLTTLQYYDQLLQEQKRHNEALEKILARLEQRFPQ
ncbi:MAG: hypothetical protein ACLPX9_17715 [Rhodomicrobium sp.]